MPDQPDFISENQKELEHLTQLAHGLTETQLLMPMEAGWTVCGVFMHLAFWDRRVLTLLEKWKHTGPGPSPVDIDVLNEAMRPLLNAVTPHVAIELAVNAAGQVVEAIARLEPDQIADIQANGQSARLNRALHWKNHLSEIEQKLGL